MTQFTAAKVRRQFLDFFIERGHREVPSGGVFPADDPTLLFTNAGMNQFKDVFLGTGSRDYKRATDTQKCLRVSGKHNDLEEVGRDTYHHTFFEMLGNWSFGDYFKEDAILWAWELLTEVWKLPKERLWVTVFEGDAENGLGADEEAERFWIEKAGVSPDRVLRACKADNFWEMGASGPCGPCTEIHIDRGGPDSNPEDGADPKIGVNAGNERFIELWNLVFIQYNRLDDGSLKDLPSKHVDTGMGFERILSVLQGKSSNYDTDLFGPIFEKIGERVGMEYGSSDEPTKIAFRVIADHVRAVSCAIADGASPSNTGRGYVVRRLIRRAARFGRQVLNMEEPFLFEVATSVADVLGVAFPEVPRRIDHIQLILKEEEIAFGRTLGRGLIEFERLADTIQGEKGQVLPGDLAYELYATYGFPQDLVEQMAEERGLTLDQKGWSASQSQHQEASKSKDSFKQLLSGEESESLSETCRTCHEADASSEQTSSKVIGYFPGGEDGPDRLVLDTTPFYAESGGQCGERGRIEGDGFVFEVSNTKAAGAVTVHLGKASGQPKDGLAVEAKVDLKARAMSAGNHSATHLLHKALENVLGEHVQQQGSYVGPDRLRFDFSNPGGVSPQELDSIERQVNVQSMGNARVATSVEDLQAAKKRGVKALFGEKYDDLVRVVDIGGWSMELCGGVHVSAAGDIGPFLILSERAVSAGVRRIEALTGAAAFDEIQRVRATLRASAGLLKTQPDELVGRIEALQTKLKEASKQKKQSAGGDINAAFEGAKQLLSERESVLYGVLDVPDLNGQSLDELAGRIASLSDSVAVVLIGREGDRVPFQVLSTGLAQERGLKAGPFAKTLGGHLKGGGGGRPDRAQGQGTDASGLEAAVAWAKSSLAEIF
ncbi:MAG: alanyl-tRNA synthetase [Candidatus Paceibacteria bacterium]|jgi:alanyl-tRNA synthetase